MEVILLLANTFWKLLLWMFAFVPIFAGMAFILDKTIPRMFNKASQFAFLFVLGVPFIFVMNYVNVWTLGYHKIGWAAACVEALVLAAFVSFLWSPRPHDQARR
jgi:hypothetical protein